jgi:hypothetical protein
MNIENLSKKLITLAEKPVLAKPENKEAQHLMKELKKAGMSNQEISKLSADKWAVPTVKGYTGGVKSSKSSPWQDAVSSLIDLITAGISLEDVKTVLTINLTLIDNKLTIENIIGFLKSVSASGLDPAQLIDGVKELQQAGLSLKDAVDTTILKDKLESYGLSLEALPTLVKVAQMHGNVQQVLDAFSVYTSITALKAAEADAKNKLSKTQAELAASNKQLTQITSKAKLLDAPIKAYEAVKKQGFNEKVLTDLSALSANYGGPEPVIEAFKEYAKLQEIKKHMNTAKSRLAEYETKISQAITKHGHLISAIEMCETLITNYKLGLDAIGTILSVTKKFGEPIDIIKAIETYGKLASLEKGVIELSGIIAEREKLLAGLEAQFKEAQEKLNGLYGVVLEVADKRGRLEGECKASENLQKLLTIIQNPEQASFSKHGQIVLMLVVNLLKWVKTYASSFKLSTEVIQDGLKQFIEEMGGIIQ